MNPGNIIILNGTSSSGKTSIVKALQQLLAEPYLDAGIDKFLWMLPKRYINEPEYWHQVFTYAWPSPGELVIEAGPLGFQLMTGMHQAVAALARAGNHAIVDHVLLEPAWVAECAEVFHRLPALFVGVRCPLEVVEQRERDRRDRTLGQARAQFHKVHAHGLYDLEVDTSQLSPEQCAQRIAARLLDGPPPQALAILRELQYGTRNTQ
jgi:chloramphenicol 3-O phosphotransferase